MELTIATFISKSEIFNPAITAVGERLRQEDIKCEMIAFSDHELVVNNKELRVIVDGGRTKYRRIKQLMKVSSYDFILCLDNDISVNIDNLAEFIKKFAIGGYAAGWGKIESKPCSGFVPKLIQLDKKLSHNFIRPLLWKFGIGISIPGQLFLLNKTLLRDSLPRDDTVFDDLQIGLVIRASGYPVLYNPVILGAEIPKFTFLQIIKQRIRWARGYAEILMHNQASAVHFIIAHGIAYHLLWILVWVGFIIMTVSYPQLWIIIFSLTILTFANNNLISLRYLLFYALFFPLLHIIWLVAVLANIIKLKIYGR